MFNCATLSLSWEHVYLLPMSKQRRRQTPLFSPPMESAEGVGADVLMERPAAPGFEVFDTRRPSAARTDISCGRSGGHAPSGTVQSQLRALLSAPPTALRSPPDCWWRLNLGLFNYGYVQSPHRCDWTINVQSVDACTKVSPSLIGPSDLRSFPRRH